MEFIRFGNLSPQEHDINYDSYHTPPKVTGIYAFPKGFIEPFLIGGVGKGSLQNGRYKKFKDKHGKVYHVKGSDFEEFKKRFPRRISKNLHLSFSYDVWYDKNEDTDLHYEDFEHELFDGTWEVWIENEPTKFNYDGLIWHHLFNPEAPQLDKEFPNYIQIIRHWVLTDIKTYERCLKATYGKRKYDGCFKNYYYNDSHELIKKKKQSPNFNYGGSKFMYSKDEFEVFIETIQNKRRK